MTINNNDKIQGFYDGYSVEEISCLDRAFAGIMSKYDERNRGLFLMLSKHMECYCLDYDKEKTIFNEKLEIIRKYWNLDIEVKGFNEEDLLRALGCGKGAIVLINMKKLYYSSYYNKNDVLHPVIITDYDEIEGIYSILCNTFESKEYKGLYRFAMRREDLILCAKSYEKDFFEWSDKKSLIIFTQTDRMQTPIDVWQKWIKVYYDMNYQNKEIIYLQELKKTEDSKEIKMIVNRMMNLEKSKNVFIREFLKMSKKFYEIKDDQSKVIQLGEDLCEQWRKYINRSIRQILHGKLERVDFNVKEIQMLEGELKSELSCVADKSALIENKDVQRLFENNEDKVITELGADEYIFEFSTKRIYNTWIVDESPKVYTNKFKLKDLDSYTYQIHLERLVDEDANYFAGIVLKLDYDIIFFGYDSSKGINIDIANKEFSLANLQTDKTEIDLQLRIVNDSIEFIYASKIFYKLPIGGELNGWVGIGCKTYNQPNYLKVKINIK